MLFHDPAMADGGVNSHGVIAVDAWKHVGRRICGIDSLSERDKDIVTGKGLRPELQRVRVDIGNHQKEGHTCSKCDAEFPKVFLLPVQKYKSRSADSDIGEPQIVGDNKKFTKGYPAVKSGMNEMILLHRSVLQINEADHIKDAV